MNRSLLALVAALLMTGVALADLRPSQHTLQRVTDPSMVVMDRGSKLEVLATERATAAVDRSGARMLQRKVVASEAAPIGPDQLGVVFNHAMQAHGYITGEITFKVKAGRALTTGSPQIYPGLKLIVAPSVYAVNTSTPAEFIRVLKRLQGSTDLLWVEPTVTYEAAVAPDGTPAAQ